VSVSDLQLQSTPQLISLTMTFYSAKLYSWGLNAAGGLGQGDTNDRSSPTQVGSSINWENAQATGIQFSVAIQHDGTLWSWGRNYAGQLGLNDVNYRSSPVQVGALTTWLAASVSARGRAAFIKKADGTLWAWGINYRGVLGLGDTTNRSSPVQVGALTTWSKIAAGHKHIAAIKTDGTLWVWGMNYAGSLGLGETTPRSSPTQVGALTTWLTLSSGTYQTIAITTSGAMWTWGDNAYGKLGLGDTIKRSSPVQIGALTTWATATPGKPHHSAAIKTNGTLWTWGRNDVGQLGLGNILTYSSPKQVGALTTWSMITCGQTLGTALKTDGTLWTWGGADFGSLGLGDTIKRSSPVQIGALTTWLGVVSNYYASLAISS
jgi:alpha-tubulin suppressor-like RCC1 family protein